MSFEYLLTALPPLPATPGGKVPMLASELARMCSEEDEGASLLSRALLVEFDIRAMERAALGVEPGETAILKIDQIKSRKEMPAWLDSALRDFSRGEAGRYSFDAVWDAFYRNLAAVAMEFESSFVMRWACFDSGLRSAVAAHRASRLKVEAPSCAADGQCSDEPYDFRRIVDEIIDIEERGEGSWKAIDRLMASARLAKARDMSAPYGFDLDELLGYVVQFIVLKQSSYLS